LTVGAIKVRKGTRELVQALALVREHIPDARLIVVGTPDAEPGYAAAVRDDIARLGLSDAVTLTGRIPEAALRAHYAAAHVFALPSQNVGSKFEGYGLALIEASAAGLAVVGSRGCGAEDAVEDGVTGLLVPQHDPAALAAALIDLLNDPAQSAQMGAAGRIAAAARTWDAAAAHYRDHYLRLL
jgi:glycosyltransferase involved in cell wall biosynthesis